MPKNTNVYIENIIFDTSNKLIEYIQNALVENNTSFTADTNALI